MGQLFCSSRAEACPRTARCCFASGEIWFPRHHGRLAKDRRQGFFSHGLDGSQISLAPHATAMNSPDLRHNRVINGRPWPACPPVRSRSRKQASRDTRTIRRMHRVLLSGSARQGRSLLRSARPIPATCHAAMPGGIGIKNGKVLRNTVLTM